MNLALAYDDIITALTLWREARGEPEQAKLGVLWVVLNRQKDPRWPQNKLYPDSKLGVCLDPFQFSCYNVKDPNAVKLPLPSDKSWQQCLHLVQSPGLVDPTMGANHYHSFPAGTPSPPWPTWAIPEKQVAWIGNFTFYKL